MSGQRQFEQVIIAEKPSVGMDLARAIGGPVEREDGYLIVGKYAISWALGHLFEQAKPEEYDPRYAKWSLDHLVFHPDHWILRPRSKKDKAGRDLRTQDGSILLDPGIAKQIKIIGNLLKASQGAINAGDAGREGQLIVDEILVHFDYRLPVKRLWLQETNLPAIRKALADMKDNAQYYLLYQSALARSQADFLVGMNLTRGYTIAWQEKGNRGVLHFGRVQTPTLAMVVARDLEIDNFVVQEYFSLRACVQHANGPFDALWLPREEVAFLGADGKPLGAKRKQDAQTVAARVRGAQAVIRECRTEEKRVPPPLPFSLGGLQKEANKQLGLSPSATLKIAQTLYQRHKLITYPRTDYEHFPESDFQYAPQIIAAVRANYGSQWAFPGNPDFSIRSAAWNDAKIGDHFALRPTDASNADLSRLTDTERAIYDLVVRQFLAQFYPHYIYDSTVVTLECEGEFFKADGQMEKQAGWRMLFATSKDAKKMLPAGMQAQDACSITACALEAKKTAPPERYTGASLIDAMEKAYTRVTDDKVRKIIKETGIGTPATRAAIIEGLLQRGYMEEIIEGKKTVYASTTKGRMLYRASPEWIRVPDLTAYFEELLKQVEKGELAFDLFMERQRKFLDKQIALVRNGEAAAAMPSPQEMRQAEEMPRASRRKGGRKITKSGTADVYLATSQPPAEMAEAISRLPLADKKMVFAVDQMTFRVSRKVHGRSAVGAAADPARYSVAKFTLPDFSLIGRRGYDTRQITGQKANERPDCGVLWLSAPAAETAGHDALIVVDHYYEQITKSSTRLRLSAKARKPPSGDGKENSRRCPKCGHSMFERQGTKGKFWGCGGYPDCRHTENMGA